MKLKAKLISLAEAGILPDFLLRLGIRSLCRKRLRQLHLKDCKKTAEAEALFIREADETRVADVPHKANDQHYEVQPQFYELVLGPRLKYSCCDWSNNTTTLARAEENALAQTCKRALLENGQSILELGCGWGSLSLWMAEKYPQSQITSLSNSNSQRKFIEDRARQKGFHNLTVVTQDINNFEPTTTFERVVSVEMFEHVRNHRELFRRIDSWLKPRGLLFTHVFCHRSSSYLFQDMGTDDWMARYFFSGGTMPGDALFPRISGSLELEQHHRWSGLHYSRTAKSWLQNMDQHRSGILKLFQVNMEHPEARKMFNRWRIFFLACAETFGFAKGQEWWVSHYLFRKP